MYLQLFDTLTLKNKTIAPSNDKIISLYTCGPTVYDYAHIGNFRTYVFEDLLKRTLLFLGYRVKHVMNLTDIDDKTIKGAIKKRISLKDYTMPYVEAFFEDLKILNIIPADTYPKATEYINKMVQIIENLMQKGIAYKGKDGSIYFSIKDFPKYGALSHLKMDELKVGASERIDADEYEKENASDFVLWKAYDEKRDGDIFWESPFGKGRPGWHIECSAMALDLLGNTIDIHCGGVDNIFPHHENEIAQSEAFTGETFVGCWAHSKHLIVNNKKMSKSLGNFFTLRDLLEKGYTGDQIRYLLLQTHYRHQLNFTFEGLDAAKKSLQRMKDFITRLEGIAEKKSSVEIEKIIEKTKIEFTNALIDDLNISPALAAIFEFIREINSLIDDNSVSKKDTKEILNFIYQINKIFGFTTLEEKEQIPPDVLDLMKQRDKARKDRNFATSDELRDKISSLGYLVEDSAKGTIVKRK